MTTVLVCGGGERMIVAPDKPWWAFWRDRTAEESIAAIVAERKTSIADYARAARVVLPEAEAEAVMARYVELRRYNGWDFGKIGALSAEIVVPVAVAIRLRPYQGIR